jgi:hypothetical protein
VTKVNVEFGVAYNNDDGETFELHPHTEETADFWVALISDHDHPFNQGKLFSNVRKIKRTITITDWEDA